MGRLIEFIEVCGHAVETSATCQDYLTGITSMFLSESNHVNASGASGRERACP